MAKDDSLMDKNAGGAAKPASSQGGGKSAVAVVLVGLLVMTVTPAVTYFIVRNMPNEDNGERPGRSAVPQEAVVMSIEPVTVNIAGTRMTRVVRVQAHLVLSESRLEPVLEKQMPMVKDRIMTTLGRRTMEELEGIDDREALKRDIVLEVNSLIRDQMSGSVIDVAFSEFLIQ